MFHVWELSTHCLPWFSQQSYDIKEISSFYGEETWVSEKLRNTAYNQKLVSGSSGTRHHLTPETALRTFFYLAFQSWHRKHILVTQSPVSSPSAKYFTNVLFFIEYLQPTATRDCMRYWECRKHTWALNWRSFLCILPGRWDFHRPFVWSNDMSIKCLRAGPMSPEESSCWPQPSPEQSTSPNTWETFI